MSPTSPSRRITLRQVAAVAGQAALHPLAAAAAPAATSRLAGKKAVVAGAARGIGRAIAVAFAREGADVRGLDIAPPLSVAEKASDDAKHITGASFDVNGGDSASFTA